MRAHQTDLSIATAAFYLAGAIFAALNASVFRYSEAPRPDLVVISLACLVAGGGVLLLGRRFSLRLAGVLMAGALFVVVPSALTTPDALRAFNMGLLFFPYVLYLVWFFRLWFARLLSYTWMVTYIVLMLWRFGDEVATVLMTLAVTGLLAGELIGHFKARLERTSITDPLCDVWNKRGFERLLGPAVTAAQRNRQSLSLLYLDLDDFKRVNDELGHAAGDRVLQEFARAVRDHSRPQDVFARFGGDEFVLLTIDANADRARVAGQRLREQIPHPSWSFGVSEWQRGESPEAFISRADLLMLTEKQERKRARP
ncbi:GGDEF domain-containing protein [Leucobacter chromiireducens]|uniref:GGDEF domain-containing protein n=1 Tax=Leucobacter chromiireducens TaxID=283877 RepID=UPI000F62ED4C|nr:GGDEF domain-containing protein [Leucobacter chromiireducens]